MTEEQERERLRYLELKRRREPNIALEKSLKEDRRRLQGTKFPVDIQPASYMDRINYLTSGIQSMGSPVIRGMEKAEETIGAPLYMLGRSDPVKVDLPVAGPVNLTPTQKEWEESVNRGRTFHKMEHEKEGNLDLGQFGGELTAALALTRGQGVQPTAVGRVFQAIANSMALAPLYSEGDTGEAAREGAKWALMLGPAAEAVPPTWKHTGKPFFEWLSHATSGPRKMAGKTIRRVLGGSADDVAKAMAEAQSRIQAEQPLTAGQAAVKSGSREMAAIQKMAEAKDPTKYGKIAERQMAAREAHLAKHAGRVDMMKSDRAIETVPKMKEALKRADIGTQKTKQLSGEVVKQRQGQVSAMKDEGQLRTMAAQQKTLAEGGTVGPHFDRFTPLEKGKTLHGGTGKPSPSAYPVPGQPRIPARYTENIHRVAEAASGADDAASIAAAKRSMVELKQYQLDSLAAHGHFPLVSKDIVRVIDHKLKDTALSTVERNALRTIKKDILGRTETDGFISSDALHTVRKEIGLKLEGIFKKMGVKWDKAQAGKTQSGIQKIIDDVIEGAGGAGWKDALKEYSQKSLDIESAAAANRVVEALVVPSRVRQRGADSFAKTTSKEPIVSAQLQKARDDVQASLNRDAKMNRMAQAGMPKASAEMGVGAIPKMPTVGPMSIKITIVRGILSRLSQKMDDSALQYMAQVADDPVVMAELIRQAGQPGPLSEVSREVLKRVVPAAAAAAVRQGVEAPLPEKIPFVGDYF